MKNQKLFVTASLLTAILSKGAFAQEALDDRWYIAPTVSYLGLDDDRMTSRSGHGLSVGLGKAVSEHINVEGKVIYNRYQHQNDRSLDTKYQWDTFGAALDVQYYLWRDTLSPYVAASAGVMDSNVSGGNAVGFIADAGVGVAYEINDALSIRSDVRYRFNDNINDNITSGNRSRYNDMVVNVGFVIPFGAKPSSAPASAPVQEPFVKETILPKSEKAKITNPDLDGDGVLNAMDQCPNTPEGYFVNEQGCDLSAPVLKGVNFAVNSSALNEESKTNLDKVAEELINYPKKGMIEVQGHTSSSGAEEYNMTLSQKRAEVVADHLKNEGVSNDITAVGYGETSPIADNATKAGKAANRRVAIIWK